MNLTPDDIKKKLETGEINRLDFDEAALLAEKMSGICAGVPLRKAKIAIDLLNAHINFSLGEC